MGRGGGLRSPPPNGGNGGRNGGKKEGKVGNRWQVLADEEAGGEEPAAGGARGEIPSRIHGSGRLAAEHSKGASPLGARADKSKKEACLARPGKENDQGMVKMAGAKRPGGVAMDVPPDTRFTPPKSKFELGVTSPLSKTLAARELIMSSIGIPTPAPTIWSKVQLPGPDLALGGAAGKCHLEGECSSGEASPRANSVGMEEEPRVEPVNDLAGSVKEDCEGSSSRGSHFSMEEEQILGSDLEDSARDNAGMAAGMAADPGSDREERPTSDMEDDLHTQAELQLQALQAAVCPTTREGAVWADCTEFHENPAYEQGGMDAKDNGMDLDGSFRCEQAQISGVTPQRAAGECTQTACGNSPKGKTASTMPNSAASKQPFTMGGTAHSPFAWNKVQLVPISKLNKESFLGKDGNSVDPEIEAVHNNIARLDRAIVAKVMGRRIAFPYLLTELKRRWFHFGEFELVTIAPNSFICVFASLEARDAMLSGGPWIVGGNIIGMDRWSPSATPNSLHGLHSPIWIRLPQLPLMYWDMSNITRIANMLGDPLWMDSHTSSWGRSSFARICVRIDLSQQLLPGVWINGIHGRFFQRVEYEGLTNFCFDCGFIGHVKGMCPARSSQHSPPPPKKQAARPKTSPPESPQDTVQPPSPSLHARDTSPTCGDVDDSPYGVWNLVTRRRQGKKRHSNVQQSKVQVQPSEPTQPAQVSREQLKSMEEISERIASPNKHQGKDHKIVFSAERPAFDNSSAEVNLSKRQHKASKAYMEKQLLQLGPIATLPRKRRKNLNDDTGGDFVPFEEQ